MTDVRPLISVRGRETDQVSWAMAWKDKEGKLMFVPPWPLVAMHHQSHWMVLNGICCCGSSKRKYLVFKTLAWVLLQVCNFAKYLSAFYNVFENTPWKVYRRSQTAQTTAKNG
jgi:hypothetical protein